MTEKSVELGYYPVEISIKAGDISLQSLSTLDESIRDVEEEDSVHADWLYAPQLQQESLLSGAVRTLPYSVRVFGLPKTHTLTHANGDSEDHLEFLIWCIGFFTGMRLTTSEAGFLDATPIKPGKLTDFNLPVRMLSEGIALSEVFWQKHSHDPRSTKRMNGIIHSLFLAQYPPYLDFERFTYLYTALDACYALMMSLTGGKSTPHAQRIDWMCRQFGMETPDWAQPSNVTRGTEISLVRNDTVHEALFFEQPLGFTIYGGNTISEAGRNVSLEMKNLVCRLVVSLLGAPNCAYAKTAVNTRSRYLLDLP